MEIKVKNDIIINDVILKYVRFVEITKNKVNISRSGECEIKNIKLLQIDGKDIIKNGELLLTCDDCNNCSFCSEVRFEIPINPHTFDLEYGFYCGKRKVFSEDINDLKTSRIKSKYDIELRKGYELINDEFKYKRANFITEKSIKKIVDDIKYCMTPCNPTADIDEYGHKRIELEEIRVSKNKYGFEVYHDGIMGDCAWTSKIYLHKKCDMDKLSDVLRNICIKHHGKFRSNI